MSDAGHAPANDTMFEAMLKAIRWYMAIHEEQGTSESLTRSDQGSGPMRLMIVPLYRGVPEAT